MSFFKKCFYLGFKLAIFLGMTGVLCVCALFLYYGQNLPDYSQLASYDPPVVTRLYTANGQLLGEYSKEHRLFVPIEAIPKPVIQAFLAAEDKNFYRHPGIDFISLARALIQNITNLREQRSLVGGSTITQQVVKNFLLTNERTLERKIREAILSFRISQAYSKDRILELYLNQIYLGAGSYGVASAAVNYFNKSLDELTLEETAFLAGLPKAPSTYNPNRNYTKTKKRRDWVLWRMHQEGFISVIEKKRAQHTPIILRKRRKEEQVKATVFAETVRKDLEKLYGEENVYESGLFVHTTLDSELQEIAQSALQRGLERYDRKHGYRAPIAHLDDIKTEWQKELQTIRYPTVGKQEIAVILEASDERLTIGRTNGQTSHIPRKFAKWALTFHATLAERFDIGDVVLVEPKNKEKTIYALRQQPEVNGSIVVMDPHTGRVLAMVGGYHPKEDRFNRATQAKRQPGSAFKPFVYLAALESGLTPATLIDDNPVEIEQAPHLPTWTPKNYSGDFLGPTPLRRGIEKSRNTMTVQLAQNIGLNKIMEVTKRFNINQSPRPLFSSVLGASETNLLALTNAYGIIINGGKRINPSFIERIQDKHGNTIYKQDPRTCDHCEVNSDVGATILIPPVLPDEREQVTDPRSAYQMTSILEGVVKRGTAISARRLKRSLGGKTGTTNSSRDAWFVGFSPDLVVGVYVGYDLPKTLGEKETGSSVALPIFNTFIKEALEGQPDVPFRIPPGIKLVKIDGDTGGLPTEITQKRTILYEAFKAGTEPDGPVILPPRPEEGEMPTYTEHLQEPFPFTTPPKESIPLPKTPTFGTGGIY